MNLKKLKKDIRKLADSKKAKIYQKFFKTGPGEYGEGDIFLGLTSSQTKEIVTKFMFLSLKDIQELLNSKIHEEKTVGFRLLVEKFEKGDEKEKKEIYDFYMKNTKKANNWDLVDVSAYKIVGAYLLNRDKSVLYKLAKSSNLWEKRISIIATFYFIKNNQFEDTLKISEILLNDTHDLIHKAVGWMLREVGKKDQEVEEKFLKKHYKIMPRTMLRYSIERFPEPLRKKYLRGEI